ncbi:MAG TPA: rhodanese-like domain-containing protein [Candidatus Binatia bacterium]
MKTTLFHIVFFLALGVLVTCASADSPATIHETTLMESGQKTLEVSTNELRKVLAEKSATVFDARPLMEYSTSHIPGAVNVSEKPGVPISQYVSDVTEVGRVVGNNRSAPIVLYCNGPFCGKSKRLSEELIAAGYTNVRRYQLGIPTWRALVGVTEIERAGVLYVLENDKTAVFLDARGPEEFKAETIPGAKSLPLADVKKAKVDGRLPMEDHNTRIIVFGRDGAQARAVTEAIAKEAFHNVSYFGGSFDELRPKVASK